MARQTNLSVPRAAPWLLALAAASCAGLALHRAAQPRPAIANQGMPALAPLGARHTTAGPRSGTSDAPGGFAGNDPMDHMDGLRDDPNFAPIWHRRQQEIIERQYGYAVASLKLPAGEAESLMELLTARREAVVDARDVAAQMGVVGPQAKMAVRQSLVALTEEIKQLAGPDAYYGVLELAPTVSACESLLEGTVGVDLASKGEPLTTDQLYTLAEGYVDAAYGPGTQAPSQAPESGVTPQLQALLIRTDADASPVQAEAIREFVVGQIRPHEVSASPDGGQGD